MGVSRLSSNSQKTPLPPTKHPPNCGQNLRFLGPNALSTTPLKKTNISQILVKMIAKILGPEIYEAKKQSELHISIKTPIPLIKGVRKCRMGVFSMKFTVPNNSFIAVSTSRNHLYFDFYQTVPCPKKKPRVACTSITL